MQQRLPPHPATVNSSTTTHPRKVSERLGPHLILLGYTVIALFPIALIIINALKSRRAIFSAPYLPPWLDTFSLEGFETVFERANYMKVLQSWHPDPTGKLYY